MLFILCFLEMALWKHWLDMFKENKQKLTELVALQPLYIKGFNRDGGSS